MQLEERTCVCGCKRKFKVLPTSPDVHYSYYECMNNTPNGGRLEFTGITSKQVRAQRRKEAREKS